MKFVCPKMIWKYNNDSKQSKRITTSENPCTPSPSGRMKYVYPEQNLRAYPGVARGSEEWDDTYKVRVSAEKAINQLKSSFCVAGRKTQNEKTLHADLLLAELVSQLPILVLLLDNNTKIIV